MGKIRILLADDQILFIESLKNVICMRATDIEVVGIAYNGMEAVEMTEKLQPDIVLLDIKMPHMNGVEATDIIHKKFPHIKIMMLTTFDDDEFVFDALSKGAKGYLLKNIPPEELLITIRALNVGAAQISPSIAAKLVKGQFHTDIEADAGVKNSKKNPDWFNFLHEKERSLLVLLSRGYSNKEIADRMHLAEQTVKNYLSIIYEKLFVSNRAGAIRKMIDSGIQLED